MGTIYENAYLTIAASLAPSDTIGFLQPRRRHLSKVIDFQGKLLHRTKRDFKVREMIDHDKSSQDPLHSRAWAFQERVMSRRILFYTSYEMNWECRESRHCECGQWRRINDLELGPYYFHSMLRSAQTDGLFEFWRQSIVPNYSGLKLTLETDRLPALSAIATLLQAKTNDTYLAGLWQSCLVKDLMWYNRRLRHKHAELCSACNPSRAVYRAPSWSWVSAERPVKYDRLRFNSYDWHTTIQVHESNCEIAGANPTGEVTDGFVCLSGPVMPAVLTMRLFSNGETSFLFGISAKAYNLWFYPDRPLANCNGSKLSQGAENAAEPAAHGYRRQNERLEAGKVWLLLVAERARLEPQRRFLVLKQSNRVHGTYERLGLVCLRQDRVNKVACSPEWQILFGRWEISRLTII